MSRRENDNGRRGGLISLIGSGVGLAAEYHEHRKQKKISRENSRQNVHNDDAGIGPSTRPQQNSPEVSSTDLPPTYDDAIVGGGDRSLASGPAASSDKKDSKAYYNEHENISSSDSDDERLEVDEEAWQLDEALEKSQSDSPPGYEESEATVHSTDDLVQDVMQTTPLRTIPKVRQPLQAPVILPQRRPRNKKRGFVRAYAPVLADSGIDQETFLKFLKNFHTSSKASPVFNVIIVSSMIAGFAPSVIAMAVTTAVQVAASAGQEMQTRQRSNAFLDQMNEELFKPAGLYAMVMKYKPDTEGESNSLMSRFGVQSEKVNLSTNEAIAKYTLSGDNQRSMSDRMKKLRLASGTTRGAIELPEAAPLIFPDLDHAIATQGAEETFKDKAKDAQKFMASYLDRRAHMKYAEADPTSQLALPEEQRKMKAKLADSNHAMWQGGLVGMVSGGKVDLRSQRGDRQVDRRYDGRERRFERDERRVLRYEQRLDHGRQLSRKQESRYDRYMDEVDRRQQQRGGGGIGGFGARRGGLIGGLIGAAASAYQNRSSENTRDGENSSRSNPPAPHGAYGGQSQQYSNPPAPYGGQSQQHSNPPAPYGGQSQHYGNPPAPYGGQEQEQYANSSMEYGAYEHQHYSNPPASHGGSHRQGGQQRGGAGSMVKKLMTEDMLYLMIVNLPNEAELAEAREALARMQK